MGNTDSPNHFKGKDAIDHVIEAQAQGIISSTEIHGAEPSGITSAAADALRDCAVVLLLTWELLNISLCRYPILLTRYIRCKFGYLERWT